MYSNPKFLTPIIQHYAWGKKSPDSLVAQLGAIKIDGKPCAELWMGAHLSAPSKLEHESQIIDLSAYIKENPELILGSRVSERFGHLPLLFKVLSVGSPLSIQAHPDLALAKLLHATDPKNYPDENHKPEAAIAITDLILLYGFKPISELKELLANTSTAISRFFDGLNATAQDLYRHLMSAEKAMLSAANLAQHQELATKQSLSKEDYWFKRCYEIYGPEDVGLLAIYLMNVVKVPSGKAIFIDSRIAHAYLDGDLIECMAASDNVIRAGLTPKFQDRQTLLSMLRYDVHLPEILELKPDSADSAKFNLKVPATEFILSRIIPGEEEKIQIDSVQIILQLTGTGVINAAQKAYALKAGDVMLIPAACKEYTVKADSGAEIFIASVP